MNDVIVWALKLIIGALILMPFVGGIGCAWIDHWYKAKTEYAAKCAEALKAMAEKARNED